MNRLTFSVLFCLALFFVTANCDDVSDILEPSSQEGPCDDVSIKLTCGCKSDGWCKYFGSECLLNEYNKNYDEG